jgi:hypothetical protein
LHIVVILSEQNVFLSEQQAFAGSMVIPFLAVLLVSKLVDVHQAPFFCDVSSPQGPVAASQVVVTPLSVIWLLPVYRASSVQGVEKYCEQKVWPSEQQALAALMVAPLLRELAASKPLWLQNS